MQIQISDNASDALELSEVLRDILDSGVLVVNSAGTVAALTPEAEALTGLRAPESLGRPKNILPLPLADLIAETLATGQPAVASQLKWRIADGSETLAHVRTIPSTDPAGELQCVVAILTNLAVAQKLDCNLRQLERLASLGALSANMAHEIRNALVAIKTFLELLIAQNRDADLAELVGGEMSRIDSIAGRMLTFAAPVKEPFASVNLNELLEQALQLMQHQIREKKLRLIPSFEAQPDAVQGNSSQLQQAFLNLLFNALEATPPDGELRVGTRIVKPDTPERRIRVFISDTGTGIPPEHIGRMLEPFFTTKPSGTGLGLSITHHIVQEHAGTLSVDTELNKGTTFWLDLPLSAAL